MAEKKKVHLALDENTHIKAKVIAVLKNITLNEFFEKAIEDAIDKDKHILDKMKK
ncbi:hypothetical protein JW930_07135 [Candidatus Woesearchaeota archaeon]|nr:hypothetical protein [Candidatus Woesearchaeota archaeon]